MTRGPDDWDEPQTDEYADLVTGEFAGIELAEFVWARQRARRMMVFWFAVVLIVTGAVAAAAWTIGSNLSALI